MLRNEQISLLALALTMPTSSFLSMRVLLIVAQLTVDGPGHYAVERLPGKLSFAVARGEWEQVEQEELELIHFHSRYSVLPALSLEEGVLHCDIIEGAFDTASFYTFIERTLIHMQPFPAPNSVIVMDNCRIHKHPDIQNLIESWYVSFLL